MARAVFLSEWRWDLGERPGLVLDRRQTGHDCEDGKQDGWVVNAGRSVPLLMGVCGRSGYIPFLTEIGRKAVHQGRLGRKFQLLERSENISE